MIQGTYTTYETYTADGDLFDQNALHPYRLFFRKDHEARSSWSHSGCFAHDFHWAVRLTSFVTSRYELILKKEK